MKRKCKNQHIRIAVSGVWAYDVTGASKLINSRVKRSTLWLFGDVLDEAVVVNIENSAHIYFTYNYCDGIK